MISNEKEFAKMMLNYIRRGTVGVSADGYATVHWDCEEDTEEEITYKIAAGHTLANGARCRGISTGDRKFILDPL